jgi:uncharacterized protein YkwD
VNGVVLRRTTIVLIAVMLAAAVALGVATVKPGEAGAADTVTVKGCSSTSVTLTAAERRMLDLHDQKRASQRLSKLCVHPALQRAARTHSQEMIDKDYFSHDSHNGESFSERVTRSGYKWWRVDENIAWGSGSLGSPDETLESWMNSSSHKANILNGRFKEIGIGAASGTYKGYPNATVWTADFGTR